MHVPPTIPREQPEGTLLLCKVALSPEHPRRKGLQRRQGVFVPGFLYPGPLWLTGGLNRRHPDERDLQWAREFGAKLARWLFVAK